MRIGELAKRVGYTVEAIRYFEQVDLLPSPVRTQGNYRSYQEHHVERLQFIRNCRALDMRLEDIRRLLQWRDQPREDCSEINTLLDAHLQLVTERINALLALESQLRTLRQRCGTGRAIEHCGILQELTTTPLATRSSSHDKAEDCP